MKADWSVARCILCLGEGPLCEEHLIPHSLGGVLTCRFLCRACNSRLGHDVEALVKSDPSVLLAVRQLSREIPQLSRRIIESHPHFSTGEGPRASGLIRDGTFHVSPQKPDDRSLILPTDKAPEAIAQISQRQGIGEAAIKSGIEKLGRMPEKRRMNILPGLDVVNWPVRGIELDLGRSSLVDPRLPGKIAFEFLALCVGEAIFARDWPLSDLRRILLQSDAGSDENVLRVERLRIGDARPFHGICIEENAKFAQIQVLLFGCLAYRVHFPHLYIDEPRYAYTHRLDTGTEDLTIVEGDLSPTAQ